MTADLPVIDTGVLIVGGGPAGLSAAAELGPHIPGGVVVVEREMQAGGIPRHSNHPGFGIRDLKRFLSGPAYASQLVERAVAAGAEIRTETMVTGWSANGLAEITSPLGRQQIAAKATILATGARERPRAARLIAGDRPRGVYTTGQLQNLVHLQHRSPGHRAVVVGGEMVSWSAVLTLRHAGCQTVLLTTQHSSPESYSILNWAGRWALRTPVASNSKVVQLMGRHEVQAVEIEDLITGTRRIVECDVVVFTGDWIPDHELARLAGIGVDAKTLGPRVDGALRTDRPGIFAVGNLIHPVDAADVAGIDGRRAAKSVLGYLAGNHDQIQSTPIEAIHPFEWICPSVLRADRPRPPRGRLLLWSLESVRRPHVSVQQDGNEIAHGRLPWPVAPGRVFRIPSSMLSTADARAGVVQVGLR